MDWISVKDRLPEAEKLCLLFGREEYEIGRITNDGIFDIWEDYKFSAEMEPEMITHWMPLPAPPTETKSEGQDMERVREIKITVMIDTNKATYEKEFDCLQDAVDFYNFCLDTDYQLEPTK